MPSIEQANQILSAGRHHQLFQTAPSLSGALAAKAATLRAEHLGHEYRLAGAPRSPNPEISGNHLPNQTAIRWLQNRYKCNQFVGDALFDAGIEMPTYRMPDGSRHYVNAEALKRFTNHFSLLQNPSDIRAGDVLVLDRLQARGENGAHVEIVTRIDHARGRMEMVGARKNGAAPKDYSMLLQSLRTDDSHGFQSRHDASMKIIALRPKRSLSRIR